MHLTRKCWERYDFIFKLWNALSFARNNEQERKRRAPLHRRPSQRFFQAEVDRRPPFVRKEKQISKTMQWKDERQRSFITCRLALNRIKYSTKETRCVDGAAEGASGPRKEKNIQQHTQVQPKSTRVTVAHCLFLPLVPAPAEHLRRIIYTLRLEIGEQVFFLSFSFWAEIQQFSIRQRQCVLKIFDFMCPPAIGKTTTVRELVKHDSFFFHFAATWCLERSINDQSLASRQSQWATDGNLNLPCAHFHSKRDRSTIYMDFLYAYAVASDSSCIKFSSRQPKLVCSGFWHCVCVCLPLFSSPSSLEMRHTHGLFTENEVIISFSLGFCAPKTFYATVTLLLVLLLLWIAEDKGANKFQYFGRMGNASVGSTYIWMCSFFIAILPAPDIMAYTRSLSALSAPPESQHQIYQRLLDPTKKLQEKNRLQYLCALATDWCC